MVFWLLLLLGLFTYVVVQRSVVNITLTPVWVLWLVMMTPALIWMGWILIHGENEPVPPALVFIPFFVCPILYWYLIQVGRPRKPSASTSASTDEAGATATSTSDRRSTVRPIDKQEESTLHHCFPWSVYYLQSIEYRPQALICKGQLRSSPEVAYRTIRENIEGRFGNRFLIVFQEGLNGKPFFALVPNPQLQTVSRASQSDSSNPLLVASISLIATLFTTTLAGALLTGVPDERVELDFSLLMAGLPYSLALMTVLGVHESAHYIAARLHNIRATFPYFIPVPPVSFFPLGTFGAFVQTRSPMPNRKALFDVAIAGPLAGVVVSIPILFWGLEHSSLVTLTDESGILNFASLEPSLCLFALISKLVFGSELTTTSAIQLHPVAIAGYLGLVVTAINLTPVGLLDGGHIVHAMFGQRIGAAIGQIARLLVLALFFVQKEFLVWAILLFFIPVVDEPALNDVSELDNKRDFWGLLALSLLVLIILPIPKSLTNILF